MATKQNLHGVVPAMLVEDSMDRIVPQQKRIDKVRGEAAIAQTMVERVMLRRRQERQIGEQEQRGEAVTTGHDTIKTQPQMSWIYTTDDDGVDTIRAT